MQRIVRHLSLLPLLLPIVGCNPDGQGLDSATTGDWQRDWSCTLDPEGFSDLQAQLTDVSSVVHLSWQTPESTIGWVAYRLPEGDLMQTSTTSASTSSHDVLLWGIPPDTEVEYRLITERDGALTCSSISTITTGGLNATLPPLTSSIPATDPVGARYVITTLTGEQGSSLAVINPEGQYLWSLPVDGTAWAVQMTPDHQGITYMTDAMGEDEDASFHTLGWDGEPQETLTVPGAHTAFTLLADGSLATLGWEVRQYQDGEDTRKILGDTLLERSPDGTLRQVWNAFDWLEPDLSQQYGMGAYMGDPQVEDWSHANSISYDTEQDAFFISLLELDMILEVDRTSGQVGWLLTAEGTLIEGPQPYDDFQPTARGEILDHPHSAHWLSNDHLLSINHGPSNHEGCAYVTELALDSVAGQASSIWSWSGDSCVQINFLGDALPLDNGDTLVVWSSAGQMEEVNPQGDVIWRVNTPLGTAFGLAEVADSLY